MKAAWFCLQTQLKHEHGAAAALRKECGIEVHSPRVRFKVATRRGPAWVTEPMFPGYIFARFVLKDCARRVQSTRGVRGIVHFGDDWPVIPDGVIRELQEQVGADQVQVLCEGLKAGDAVVIAGGVFHSLSGLVTRVMSGRQRVLVLLEFLGRQTTVEVGEEAVVRES